MTTDLDKPASGDAVDAAPDDLFRSMADCAPVMMWVTDADGRCVYLNRLWYEFTGQTPEDAAGYGWLDATHPDDREAAGRIFLEANAERRGFRIDYRLRRADGVYRGAIDAASPRFGPDGDFLGYVGSVIDVEERRQAEARLALGEERLRLAADAADIGFWDVDLARNRLFWTPRVKQMFGVPEGAGVSLDDFYDGLHPEDRERTATAFKAACDPATRALYDVEYRTVSPKDGTVRWVAAKGRAVFDAEGGCTRALGTAIDITERKRTEAALRESESRYSALFEAIDAGFCVVEVNPGPPDSGRVDYRVVEANPAFYAHTGFAPEVLGRWLREAAPELEEHWFETYGRVARSGQPERFEQGSALLDRWFDVYAFPAAGRAGETHRRVAILFNDISARRRAEEQLRELNEQLELRVAERTAERDEFWKNSGDLMLVAGHDGRMLAVNPAWTEVLGWPREQLIGRRFFDFIHPGDLADSEAEAGRLGTTGGPALHFRNRYRRADGGWIWLSWAVSSKDARFYAVARDVTAERAQAAALAEAQKALRQSQKLEAIGSLTGGVAHDFNNLLTPIIGSLDLLQRRGRGDVREQKLIEGAIQAAERAKTLVQRLLAFARRQPLQATAVDLGRLVENMAELIASTTGPQIKVAVDMAAGLPAASADLNQVEMALLNLAVNARDAMPDGGVLRITATAETVADDGHPMLRPGDYVRLSVSDTGVGMDPATLERAIEPFYSTKGVGKGTGLGLSMVHGLASQLGGALTIQSRPGLGTNVELWLPVSGGEADAVQTGAGPRAAADGAGTALLVDDEDLVRMTTADMLADYGYQVVEAGSGDHALALVRDGLRPSVVVTDHLMPGMSGADLARTLRAEHPDLPILIVSGYVGDDGGGTEFPSLAKPFRSEELAGSLAALTALPSDPLTPAAPSAPAPLPGRPSAGP